VVAEIDVHRAVRLQRHADVADAERDALAAGIGDAEEGNPGRDPQRLDRRARSGTRRTICCASELMRPRPSAALLISGRLWRCPSKRRSGNSRIEETRVGATAGGKG
jgi:hypothetical protein